MRYSFDTKVAPQIKEYVKPVVKSFIDYLIVSDKIKSKTNSRVQIATIVTQVFFNNAYLINTINKREVTITLDSKNFSKAHILNGVQGKVKVSYQYTLWLFEYMSSLGLCSIEKGGLEYDVYINKGRYDYRIINSTTSTLTFENSILSDMEDLRIDQQPCINVIILRDKNKSDTTFKMPIYLRRLKDTLIEANKKYCDLLIQDPVNGKVYPLQLRKIFNINFRKGGRMYDLGIQNLPKIERYRLLIDGKKTCVHDFKAFETSLVYSLQGEKMEGDPYMIDLEGYDRKVIRRVCKMIMTRIYYCKDYTELNMSVSKSVSEEFSLNDLVEKGMIPEKRIPVGQIIDLLTKKHECIMEHFYGKGDYDPSYIGSLVMDYIFEYMVQNHKTAIIPVFDEVICDRDFEYEVQDVMRKAYVHVVGSDINCMIVKEK